MPVAAKFLNVTEAALFQSVLEGEGIASTILDSGVMAGVVDPVRVEVAAADLSRAKELLHEYTQTAPTRAAETEAQHFARGFSFVRVWLLLSFLLLLLLAGWLGYGLTNARKQWPAELEEWIFGGLTLLGAPVLGGLLLTVNAFIGWMLWHWCKARGRRVAPLADETEKAPPAPDSL